MEEVAKLLNDMVKAGVISDYAVFGAVAQMRYTEAVATIDADILISVPGNGGLDILSPIYAFCRERGYEPEGEAVRVGDWPVQFIPSFSDLTAAAIHDAEDGDLDGIILRVVRADYLAVLALSVGRAKNYARILALREAAAVSNDEIEALAKEYNLTGEWQTFRSRFDEE